MGLIKISVIIPTYNRLKSLKRVLEGLQRQDYPADQFEVIVVSDGSTDGSNQYLAQLQTSFRFMARVQDNQGVACARNAAIHLAEGSLVVFLDDDTVPANDFLSQHFRLNASHGDDAIIIGPMLAPFDHRLAPWAGWEQTRLNEQYQDMENGRWDPTPRQFYTANASIARRHLLDVGGFDPSFRRAEDVELAYRLERKGLRFIFDPSPVVYHYIERSFDSWMSIPYAYGVNDVVFTYDRGQTWLLPTVFKEFHSRSSLVRALTWICLNRKFSTAIAQFFIKRLILFSNQLGMVKLSHLACGGMFNLRYYQGVSDGLGGRQVFFAEVKNGGVS